MINSEGGDVAFLLSMPRSGSTLLSLMLGSHPEICCPPEPWILLVLAEYLELGDIRKAPYGRQWAEIAAMEFLLAPERKQRGIVGTALGALRLSAGLDAMAAAKKVARAAYQMHLDVSGKRVFIDKTPRYYAALDLLDQIYSQEKKIVLLRNPLDIFASYKSTWEIQRSIFSPEGVLVHTRDFCEGLFSLANYAADSRKNALVLRYEDLVRGPNIVLRSVCEFMEIKFSPAMLRYHENTPLLEEYRRSPVGDPVSSNQPKPAHSFTVNAWEQRLETADIQALIDVLGINIFERLGYSDTIIRLRALAVKIPTEEQASALRASLLRSMVERVQEEPFSVWQDFISPLRQSQADRATRLEVIRRQHTDMTELRLTLDAVDGERAAQLGVLCQQQVELDELRQSLIVSEADRAARLEVIQCHQMDLDRLGQNLSTLEADREARLGTLRAQQVELDELRANLETSEEDRSARLKVIQDQQTNLDRLGEILAALEVDREARLEVIHAQQMELDRLGRSLAASEADREARLEALLTQQADLDRLGKSLAVSEADRAARLEVIRAKQDDLDRLGKALVTAQTDCDARGEVIRHQQLELGELKKSLADSEADRVMRLELIRRQQAELGELGRELAASKADTAVAEELVRIRQQEIQMLRSYAGFLRHQLNKLKKRIYEIVKK